MASPTPRPGSVVYVRCSSCGSRRLARIPTKGEWTDLDCANACRFSGVIFLSGRQPVIDGYFEWERAHAPGF